MKPSTADIENRVKVVRDSVESGIEKLDQYRPVVARHRWTVLAVALGALVAIGAVVMITRRRRPRPLTVRLRQALPDSVSERLERPLSTVRARLGR